MTTDREKRLEEILCNFLRPMRDIPFELFIQGLFEQRVVKFDKSRAGNLELLNLMKQAMRNACHEIQAQPIVRPRPNEVGNDMEQPAITQLRRIGLDAKRPKTRDDKGHSVGYPDIEIVTDLTEVAVYIEVKTFNKRNKQTTQRAFYLSPSQTHAKVTKDAHHILVGFEMTRNGDEYRPVAFDLVDLYGLSCDVKHEIQSDNRRIYQPERILHEETVLS